MRVRGLSRTARRVVRHIAAMVGVALVVPASALGATKDPEQLPIPENGAGPTGVAGGGGSTLLRMGIGLLVVLLAIGAVWYVLKRIRTAKYPEMDARGSDIISVLSTTPLGPNRNLHLVRIGDQVVVVGATEHAISAVARLGDDEAVMLSQDLSAPDARGAFPPSTGSTWSDARFRAPASAGGATALDRLRALTTRR